MQMNLGCPTPRAAHGMCAVSKYLVIFGGRDCDGRKNDLHIFNTGMNFFCSHFAKSLVWFCYCFVITYVNISGKMLVSSNWSFSDV